MYKFYNANSHGNFVNDCVIRAISLAERKTWDETYEKMSDLAQEKGLLFDDINFVEDYLDKHYERQPHCAKTVGDFVKSHPKGTYLITMQGHISCCVQGILYDLFDCTSKPIWDAWKVNH